MKLCEAYPSLIADSESKNFVRQVSDVHFSYVTPTKVKNPTLLSWSNDLATELGILTPEVEALAGNTLFHGSEPIASRYGGHQFGHWAGQLGDGRAITLGEYQFQNKSYEIQLKGAGPTPYSRNGDGRAVLRSSLREYLCSEAMHFLHIPTTRALSLVTTGEEVLRDVLYDGNPAYEPGAIVCRVAPSFLRFGNFEIHARLNEFDSLKKLVDYTIRRYYPELSIEEWFREITHRTADLMVEWMRVGFVHGVMNTDNMSILGLTIDYGPYGWLDVYDPSFTPNTTDAQMKRYQFQQQPSVAYWNLHQLAKSLESLTPNLAPILSSYEKRFVSNWQKMMAKKVGLTHFEPSLIIELDQIMRLQETDMTIFYRKLADILENQNINLLEEAFYEPIKPETNSRLLKWTQDWKALINQSGRSLDLTKEEMNQTNPYFICRNYIVQEALDGLSDGDVSILRKIERALKTPYEENEFTRPFFKQRPSWARDKPGCSKLSCSS